MKHTKLLIIYLFFQLPPFANGQKLSLVVIGGVTGKSFELWSRQGNINTSHFFGLGLQSLAGKHLSVEMIYSSQHAGMRKYVSGDIKDIPTKTSANRVPALSHVLLFNRS